MISWSLIIKCYQPRSVLRHSSFSFPIALNVACGIDFEWFKNLNWFYFEWLILIPYKTDLYPFIAENMCVHYVNLSNRRVNEIGRPDDLVEYKFSQIKFLDRIYVRKFEINIFNKIDNSINIWNFQSINRNPQFKNVMMMVKSSATTTNCNHIFFLIIFS